MESLNQESGSSRCSRRGLLRHPLNAPCWASYKQAFDHWHTQQVEHALFYSRPAPFPKVAFGNIWPVVRDEADATAAARILASALQPKNGGRIIARPLLRIPTADFEQAMRRTLPATIGFVELPTGFLSYGTFSIDLSKGFANVVQAFNPTTRRQIKQIETGTGVSLVSNDRIDFERYFLKYSENMAARGAEALTRKRFEYCFTQFGPSLYTVMARDDDTGSEFYHTTLSTDDVAYSFLISNDRSESGSRASRNLPRYVLYLCIKRACEGGLSLYDLGGVSLTDQRLQGITEFKRGFGGEYSANNCFLFYTKATLTNRLLCQTGLVQWALRVARHRRAGPPAPTPTERK